MLPPYNTGISEKNWQAYYEERAALDEINTPDSDASKPIVSEELGQDTWNLLRKASMNVAKVIYGSVADEEERKQIARVIRGSLYYTDLWGNDEEGYVFNVPLRNLHLTIFCSPVVAITRELSTRRRVCTHPMVSARPLTLSTTTTTASA